MEKVFNAINGVELRQMIVADLDEFLKQNTEFRQHLTYPKVSYSLKLEVEAFVRENEKFATERKKQVVAKSESGEEFQPDPGEQPAIIELSKSKVLSSETVAPDASREEAGIPVTAQEVVPNVGKVDAPAGRGASTRGMIRNRASEGYKIP